MAVVCAGLAVASRSHFDGLAISLLRLDGHASIAAAHRHHARGPQGTLKLLQNCMSGFAVSLAAGLPL